MWFWAAPQEQIQIVPYLQRDNNNNKNALNISILNQHSGHAYNPNFWEIEAAGLQI